MKVTIKGIIIEGTAEELRPWLPPVPSAVAEATGIPWEDDLRGAACAPWESGGSPTTLSAAKVCRTDLVNPELLVSPAPSPVGDTTAGADAPLREPTPYRGRRT